MPGLIRIEDTIRGVTDQVVDVLLAERDDIVYVILDTGREGNDLATLVANDDDYDNFSNLNRPSVFRLSIGVSKQTYQSLFGAETPRPGTKDSTGQEYDFTLLDTILPHPVYGKMYWVCVLNPGETTFETVKSLLAEAHDLAVRNHDNRVKRG